MTTPDNQKAPRGLWRAWMLPAGVLLLGILELALLITIAVQTSVWWAILAVVIGWIIGFALVIAAGQQSITRLVSVYRAVAGRGEMKQHMSRPAFTMLAALLFFFPGLITDVAGLILLLTPVQRQAVKKSGLGQDAGRRRIVFGGRRPVIDGEIIIDTTADAGPSSAPRPGTTTGAAGTGAPGSSAPGSAQQKTPPPVLEGDVLGPDGDRD